MDNRAVSNTLGYILLFAVLFVSLTLVGTVGVDSMKTARDGAMQVNAERTMTGIADAMADIHDENVGRRMSRVELGTGTIESGAESTINITVGGTPIIDDESVDPLVYRIGDSRFIYEAGAVFLVQSGGGRVVRKPPMRLDENGGNILPVIKTTTLSDGSISGSKAQVIMTHLGGQTTVETSGPISITITTTDIRAPLWKSLLNDQIGSDECSVISDNTVRCRYSPSGGSMIIVHSTEIRYELET